MGVYLSSPITEKESVDEQCAEFSYGASSMQGWRINQEDAHNCIPDFNPESKTSFFAVYDGHGGSEVAKYCELHFPEFVKMLIESQKDPGDTEKIIKSAFLAFDATLTQDEVVKELKVLCGKDDEEDEIDEDDPVGRTETDKLKEEADMPLNELLAKYGKTVEDGESDNQVKAEEDGPSCSSEAQSSRNKNRFLSPAIRAKGVSRTSASSSQKDVKTDLPSSTTADIGPSSEASPLSPSSSSQISGNKTSCASNSLSNGAKSKKGGKKSHIVDKNGQTNNNDINKQSCESSDSSSDKKIENNCTTEDCSSSADLPESSSKMKEESGSGSGSVSSSGPGCVSSSGSGSNSGSGSGSSSGSGSGSGSGSSSSQNEVSSSSNSNAKQNLEDDDGSSSDDDEEDKMWEEMSDDSSDDDDEDECEHDDEVPMMDMSREEPGSDSGCTACVCLLQGKKVIVANAGDSRCVLSRNGVAVELSFDHKPEDDPERERIEKAGGKVTSDGRVNGGLNLSRAIGDHVYKRNKELPAKDQMITSLPDIETAELSDDDQFIVIACDGIWNYMSSQEVVDYVSQKLKDPEKRKKPSLVCEELFDHCLAPNTHGDGTGCDNMTCIIVVFSWMKNSTVNEKSAGEPTVLESEPTSLKRPADDAGDTEPAKKLKEEDAS